jgi:hypothetical protein
MPKTKTWEPTLRPCGNCQSLFVPKTRRQTCCSPECGKEKRNRMMRQFIGKDVAERRSKC